MDSKTYDFAIIGAGAAGLQLASKMARDSFFDDKEILILEKDQKTANDRTWSFWEKGESEWDHIATKIWKKGLFIGDKEVTLDLTPYTYKTIRSSEFYSHGKSIIKNKKNFKWVNDVILHTEKGIIKAEKNTYSANYIFDSRIDPAFFETQEQYDALIQHFKGWFIETKEEVFNPEIFTMMDYSIQWKDHTSFTYVLPFSSTKALVEFTLFDHQLLQDEEYDKMLNEYLKKHLKVDSFKILDIEKGQIPMSTYPFHNDNQPQLTKIGTAGGWVRPSSGYTFKNIDKATSKVIGNIKKGEIPHSGIHNKKHWLYDLIFLKVFTNHNELGVDIFSTFYQKHPVQRILRFLDQESSLREDLLIINSLDRKEFRNAFFSMLKFW